jgi:AraC-like DNA-binding protein
MARNQRRESGRLNGTVYRPFLGALWRAMESYGLNPEQVIDPAIYSPDAYSAPSERLAIRQQDDIYLRALAASGDPAVGIRMGEHLLPSHFGALGHAWLASSTLRTALQRTQRFARMMNERMEFVLDTLPEALRVSVRADIDTRCPEMRADFQVSCLVTMCRYASGASFVPARVQLRRAEPTDRSAWDRFFGIEVRFGQPVNALSIPLAAADRRSTGSNPALVALHEEVIERSLAQLDRGAIGNRARFAITDQLPSGGISEDTVAQALNVSTRSLHRKLKNEGLAFNTLLQDVRQRLARKYIDEPGYRVTEIAFLLGYADPSAFSRAFRAWFGVSPTEARRRRAPGAPFD